MVKKLSPSYHNKQVTTLDNGNFQSPYPEEFKLISTIIITVVLMHLETTK